MSTDLKQDDLMEILENIFKKMSQDISKRKNENDKDNNIESDKALKEDSKDNRLEIIKDGEISPSGQEKGENYYFLKGNESKEEKEGYDLLNSYYDKAEDKLGFYLDKVNKKDDDISLVYKHERDTEQTKTLSLNLKSGKGIETWNGLENVNGNNKPVSQSLNTFDLQELKEIKEINDSKLKTQINQIYNKDLDINQLFDNIDDKLKLTNDMSNFQHLKNTSVTMESLKSFIDNKNYDNEKKVINEKNKNDQTQLLEDHKKDLSDVIDNEVVGDNSNQSYVSKDELEGMLDEHLLKVQALLEDYNKKENKGNISDIKVSLKELVNNFKQSIKDKFTQSKSATQDSIQKVKNHSKDKIKESLSNINETIKTFSKKVDDKLNLNANKNPVVKNDSVNHELLNTSYAQKVKAALGNDKSLYMKAFTAYNIHALEKNILSFKEKLNELNVLEKENPSDQITIKELKNEITDNITNTEKRLEKLTQSVSVERTLDDINQNATKENDENDKSIENESKVTYKETTNEVELEH
ncbi:hypothetical protein EV207_12518 [Scopulibacillus darangshiensis]|uniref:Uncharacterized protein n=1 Tax=Scopulibacillus darangshiensis TaxID=442528 RepID=A0A4R2NSP8_9BACL|nr:hypothetical protein [Scopulibacillus darangshiensis]TCP24458.1 hypothetical protein EV207_12518 [Scopulibacillus darangshiensis]